MSDPLNQKISQYLDDDLNPSESLQLLQAMQQHPNHQATMQRYLLIKQALNMQPKLMAGAAFSAQLQEQLAQEPAYLLPRRRPKTDLYRKSALALAASLLAVMVIVPAAKKINAGHLAAPYTLAQQKSSPSPGEAVGGVAVSQNGGQAMRLYPVNKRFQDYLQAHNGSLYTNGASGQYGAQLASYGKD